MNKATFAILSFIFLGGAANAAPIDAFQVALGEGATVNCADSVWTEGPMLVGKAFKGSQEIVCQISLNHSGNLPKLDQFLTEYIKKAQTVHSGPTPEIYANLPSVHYDITIKYVGQETVTMREDVHLATDLKTRLVFESFSSSVAGSGFAAYIRKVDSGVFVTRLNDDGTQFEIKVTNSIVVNKPWYSPSGVFFSKARDNAVAQFRQSVSEVIPGYVENL